MSKGHRRGPGRPQGNVNQLMQQAMQMQAEVQRRQEELTAMSFRGTAGGGVVEAVVRGNGTLEQVTIDPSVLDDAEMVGDLVVAAVNQALQERDREAAKGLAGLEGVGGLDLGGLLG